MIKIKEGAGVLIDSKGAGNLWIPFPCWDHNCPFNLHDVPVSKTIVLNNLTEGCFPLSSLLAADNRISTESINVLDAVHPHDWHPGYNEFQKENIQLLLSTKQLPEHSLFGQLEITKPEEGNFVRVEWNDDSGKRIAACIGQEIYIDQIGKHINEYYLIGSFGAEKIQDTFSRVLDFNIRGNKVHITLSYDLPNASTSSLVKALNSLGLTVYTLGKEEPVNS